MKVREITTRVKELHDSYITFPLTYWHTIGQLSTLGYTEDLARALVDLWANEESASLDGAVEYGRFAEVDARVDALVACNPIFQTLQAVDAELSRLDDEICALRFRFAPLVQHSPQIPSLTELKEIAHYTCLLAEKDLPHFQSALRNLGVSLHHNELVLQKLSKGETDTMTLGDYVDEYPTLPGPDLPNQF